MLPGQQTVKKVDNAFIFSRRLRAVDSIFTNTNLIYKRQTKPMTDKRFMVCKIDIVFTKNCKSVKQDGF